MERVKSGFMQCQAGNHDHLDFICYLCAVAVWCERERGVCVCVLTMTNFLSIEVCWGWPYSSRSVESWLNQLDGLN